MAADWHCDQHLHKMILESAQMLSTAMHMQHPKIASSMNGLYKPTHINHPCNIWLRKDAANANWLVELCFELDAVRRALGSSSHASMLVVRMVQSFFLTRGEPTSFVFCGEGVGPNVHEQYRDFYQRKAREWRAAGRPMTYNGRDKPYWLKKI